MSVVRIAKQACRVLGEHWGNHVGDWEYNMIRFNNGAPQTIYYSEHSGGAAYQWSAVQKKGQRPVSYVATGSHANYAVSVQLPMQGASV